MMMLKKDGSDWYKDLAIYQIYPKSFMDADGDGIGDLKGIISKLGYLRELGINAIWLSPIYRSPFVDNGYDISDYDDIDPVFGSMDDFRMLLDKAHSLGIYVIMDLVVNHSSDQHRWFIESSKSRDNEYADYYIWHDPVDGREPNNWEASFGGSAWTYVKERGQYYLHIFSPSQPDLNWKSQKLRKEIFSMIGRWCEMGVDGFRVDAISYLEKADFSYSPNPVDATGYALAFDINSNRPGTHSTIREMRTGIWDKYNAMTVGEVCCYSPQDLFDYSSDSRKEFSMAIPFVPPIVEISTWSPLKMKRSISENYSILKEDGWWARFLSNHDKPRQVSLYGDDSTYWKESAKMLATITDLLPGTPFIFQGEEIGMTNVYYKSLDEYDDLDTRNVYEHGIAEGKSHEEAFLTAQRTSRDNARSPMQWTGGKNAGFSDGTPWLGVNENHAHINVEEEEKNPDSILSYYKALLRLRASSKALRRGDFSFIDIESETSFCFRRTLGDEEYVVISNFSGKENAFSFDTDGYEAVLSVYSKDYSRGITTLLPYECVVLRKTR